MRNSKCQLRNEENAEGGAKKMRKAKCQMRNEENAEGGVPIAE